MGIDKKFFFANINLPGDALCALSPPTRVNATPGLAIIVRAVQQGRHFLFFSAKSQLKHNCDYSSSQNPDKYRC